MSDLMKVGADFGGAGTFKPFTATISGAQRVSDTHARYMDAVLAGRVFSQAVTGGAATAYTGGAGGTPLIAVHNPVGSNKYLVPLYISISGKVAASAAGTVSFAAYAGVSVQPTGTQTVPRSAISLQLAGSSMLGFSNAALTGSTALTLAQALGTYYWATAAGAFLIAPVAVDMEGLPIIASGNQIAIGGSSALTSATYDAVLYWEEVPMLVNV